MVCFEVWRVTELHRWRDIPSMSVANIENLRNQIHDIDVAVVKCSVSPMVRWSKGLRGCIYHMRQPFCFSCRYIDHRRQASRLWTKLPGERGVLGADSMRIGCNRAGLCAVQVIGPDELVSEVWRVKSIFHEPSPYRIAMVLLQGSHVFACQ